MKSRWELILMNLITERLNNRSMNLQLDQVQLYNITSFTGLDFLCLALVVTFLGVLILNGNQHSS